MVKFMNSGWQCFPYICIVHWSGSTPHSTISAFCELYAGFHTGFFISLGGGELLPFRVEEREIPGVPLSKRNTV